MTKIPGKTFLIGKETIEYLNSLLSAGTDDDVANELSSKLFIGTKGKKMKIPGKTFLIGKETIEYLNIGMEVNDDFEYELSMAMKADRAQDKKGEK